MCLARRHGGNLRDESQENLEGPLSFAHSHVCRSRSNPPTLRTPSSEVEPGVVPGLAVVAKPNAQRTILFRLRAHVEPSRDRRFELAARCGLVSAIPGRSALSCRAGNRLELALTFAMTRRTAHRAVRRSIVVRAEQRLPDAWLSRRRSASVDRIGSARSSPCRSRVLCRSPPRRWRCGAHVA